MALIHSPTEETFEPQNQASKKFKFSSQKTPSGNTEKKIIPQPDFEIDEAPLHFGYDYENNLDTDLEPFVPNDYPPEQLDEDITRMQENKSFRELMKSSAEERKAADKRNSKLEQ